MQGRTAEALTALDEVMVYVVADPVAPQVVGLAYCIVISVCMERFDIERAAEWTQALTGWRDANRGRCPTAASARCIGLRSSSCTARGPKRLRRLFRSANVSRPRATLPAARITGLPSYIDCAVSSTWPSASTPRRRSLRT